MTLALAANVENLTLTGASAINGTGNGLANSLVGNAAANTLDGGLGADTLAGNLGKDTLTGGDGADTFVYTNALDTGNSSTTRDLVTDFVSGTDKFNVSAIDADPLTDGDQAWAFVGDFTGAAGEIRFVQASQLVQFDQNGDGVADFSIEVTGVASMVASDFIVV